MEAVEPLEDLAGDLVLPGAAPVLPVEHPVVVEVVVEPGVVAEVEVVPGELLLPLLPVCYHPDAVDDPLVGLRRHRPHRRCLSSSSFASGCWAATSEVSCRSVWVPRRARRPPCRGEGRIRLLEG